MADVVPATGSRSVFLSYAREDAAAARRIAEALRAAGLEVWFDEAELRGGDEWDARIRKQIDACALFIPLISAHTQERNKGYFRFEWKLAVDETYLLAAGVPFITPVVIDDTREAGAVVPPEFMKVHWTRLPGALPTPQFVEQVKRLLSGGPSSREAGGNGRATASPELGPPKKSLPIAAVVGLAAVALGAGVVFFSARKPAPATTPDPKSQAPDPSRPPQADAKSIAVLPLVNRSNRDEDLFFTDGVHDELLTQISRIRAIKTISRTSVMGYRGTTKNMKVIGAELGVATILEGGVQRAGNRVRINVQLIDVATDAHLWAEIYDREVTAENIFRIQSEIATAIAAALRANLLPGEQEQLQKTPTHNLAALEAYFQGQALLTKGTSTALQERISHLKRAIELDPNFVPAYAQLANAYLGQIYFDGRAVAAQLGKAEPLVNRALELDPQSGEAYAALGELKRQGSDPVAAEVAYRRALELNPNLSSSHFGYAQLLFWNFGRDEAALAEFERARQLDPVKTRRSGASTYLQALGRFDEARALLEEDIREYPESAWSHLALGTLYAEKFGQFELALQTLRRGYSLDPASVVYPKAIGDLYARIGDAERAIEWYERTLAIAPEAQNGPLLRLFILYWRGERDKFRALSASVTAVQAGPYFGNFLWVFKEFELREGRPGPARARYAAAFPEFFAPTEVEVHSRNAWLAKDIASVLLATGEKEQAALLLKKAEAVFRASGNVQMLAGVQALAGDRTGALATLQRAVTTNRFPAWGEDMTDFDGLRQAPEFKAIMDDLHTRLADARRRLRDLEAGGTLGPVPPPPKA